LGRLMALTHMFTMYMLIVTLKRLLKTRSDKTISVLCASGWLLLTMTFPLGSFVARKVEGGSLALVMLYLSMGLWVVGRPVGSMWWRYAMALVFDHLLIC